MRFSNDRNFMENNSTQKNRLELLYLYPIYMISAWSMTRKSKLRWSCSIFRSRRIINRKREQERRQIEWHHPFWSITFARINQNLKCLNDDVWWSSAGVRVISQLSRLTYATLQYVGRATQQTHRYRCGYKDLSYGYRSWTLHSSIT